MGTFDLIPGNLTKAYLAVRRKYTFNSIYSYAFLAMVFNAQNYIESRKLTVDSIYTIVNSAKDHEESMNDEATVLTSMFMPLMILYFEQDVRSMSIAEISRTVFSQRYHIMTVIQKNLRKGKTGFFTGGAVDVFFSSGKKKLLDLARDFE